MEIWGRATFRWRGRARNRQVELFLPGFKFSVASVVQQNLSGFWAWLKRNRHFVSWNVCKSLFRLKLSFPNLLQVWAKQRVPRYLEFVWKIYVIPKMRGGSAGTTMLYLFYLFYLFISGLSLTTAWSGSKMRGASVGTTPGLEHYAIIQTASKISQVYCALTEKRNISQSDSKLPICWAIKFS